MREWSRWLQYAAVVMQQILHVVVVGFHHKKGCQVEYAFPPLPEPIDSDGLPPAWKSLPSLALPDGSHNYDQDVTYFILPSLDDPDKAIFGISCFRQIASEALTTTSSDVTRNTVQKSVCVLSRSPLFGVLKAKLQLITQAYFNEKDFSKVDVLAQMHSNLCDMFNGGADLVDGQAASMDISVRSLIRTFRHRVVLLFKLMLLERKVLFHMFPLNRLGDTLIALLSLFPNLLEEGLTFATSQATLPSPDKAEEAIEAVIDEDNGEEKNADEDAEEAEITVARSRPDLGSDPLEKVKDSFGFPLSIFTMGNIFNPYVGLAHMDLLNSKTVRGFVIGATNALFPQRKNLFDVMVTVDSEGVGSVEVFSVELRKALSLTAADLRFADFLIKNVEGTEEDGPAYEGGNEWCREQFRSYLLSLGSSVRSGLAPACADFGTLFVSMYRETVNCRRWIEEGKYEDMVGVPPGHPFSGQLGVYDMMLRVEHSVGGSEQARKALSAISSTGKSLSVSGGKMKTNLSSWFKGVTSQASQVLSSVTTPADAKETAPDAATTPTVDK